MATPSKGTQEKTLGVVIGILILLGLYGLYQFLSGSEEAVAEPPSPEPTEAEARPSNAPVRPLLPPSGKASQLPRGASGGAGPGGAFQVTEPGEGAAPIRSSNPFASGGAGKRQGSGGGNAGGGL